MCVDYAGSLAGLSYEAEKRRLIAEMEKYGLYDKELNAPITSLDVDYVEIPDIVSSGGNINIYAGKSDNVNGSGKLEAKGAPKVTINNNSNLYMKVNDITVVEPGGDIRLNNKSLGDYY